MPEAVVDAFPFALGSIIYTCGEPRRRFNSKVSFDGLPNAYYHGHPMTTEFSSANSYSGTSKFRGAGPFLARPETS